MGSGEDRNSERGKLQYGKSTSMWSIDSQNLSGNPLQTPKEALPGLQRLGVPAESGVS